MSEFHIDRTLPMEKRLDDFIPVGTWFDVAIDRCKVLDDDELCALLPQHSDWFPRTRNLAAVAELRRRYTEEVRGYDALVKELSRLYELNRRPDV